MKNWKTSTKIMIVAGLILLLVLALLIAWWVQSRSKDEMKNDTVRQILQVEAIMSQPQKEQIALLAIKYGIDEALVEKILDEYAAKHDIGYKVRKNLTGAESGRKDCELKVNLDFAGTLNELSVRYSIPKDKLASLLIDFRLLSGADKGNVLETLLSSKAKQSIMNFSVHELLGGVKRLSN